MPTSSLAPVPFAEGTLPVGIPEIAGRQSLRNRLLLLRTACGKARDRALCISRNAADGSGRILAGTGKSCPMQAQQTPLRPVTDLESRSLLVAGRRVLILGCHDLNMFSQRAWKKQKPGSPRRRRTAQIRKLAKEFRPELILHHPHTTESPRTWQTAWAGARRLLHPAAWASAIHYPDQPDCRLLDPVLAQTRSPGAPVLDILFAAGCPRKYCVSLV